MVHYLIIAYGGLSHDKLTAETEYLCVIDITGMFAVLCILLSYAG